MPLDLSNMDTCPSCDSCDVDKKVFCEKCGDDILICAKCRTITIECKCGHCEAGARFRETGE